ncbi:hypothetical protein ACOME3_003055 [Neoechinorhynchus agilis]
MNHRRESVCTLPPPPILFDWTNPFLPPPPVRLVDTFSADRTAADASIRSRTALQGQRITCFVTGGEKRLCLPEVLFTVFKEVPFTDIQAAYIHLNIYTSYCTAKQLEELKRAGVIPLTSTSCSLITQADAERLCHILLPKKEISTPFASIPNSDKLSPAFSISHNCFGNVKGFVYPQLYTKPSSHCIRCQTCNDLKTRSWFDRGGGIHRSEDGPKLCHWGLDSNKWRLYIILDQRRASTAVAVHFQSLTDNELKLEFEKFKQKFVDQEGGKLENSRPPSYESVTRVIKKEEVEQSIHNIYIQPNPYVTLPLKRTLEERSPTVETASIFVALDVRYTQFNEMLNKTSLNDNEKSLVMGNLLQLYTLNQQCMRALVHENTQLAKCLNELQINLQNEAYPMDLRKRPRRQNRKVNSGSGTETEISVADIKSEPRNQSPLC